MCIRIFNRYLKIHLLILAVVTAESCRTPRQTLKSENTIENTVIENVDDTTTVETTTVVTTIPTQGGGTQTTTNEKKRIINHKSKKAKEHHQVSQDEQKTDGITPVLEREKTKRQKSDNKRIAKVAKEERKAQQDTFFSSLVKRLIGYAIVATLLYFWIKRK